MPPSIDIDQETFEHLKAHAEPFVDTPATVLRRLLGLEGSSATHPIGVTPAASTKGTAERRAPSPSKRGKRAGRGTLLPEREYEAPILRYLAESGGRAPSREVVERVGEVLADKLTAEDREQLRSGEIRWKSRVAFVRLRLVEKGDLDGQSPRGTWQITEQGRQRLAAMEEE
jgi:hypothetical protein